MDTILSQAVASLQAQSASLAQQQARLESLRLQQQHLQQQQEIHRLQQQQHQQQRLLLQHQMNQLQLLGSSSIAREGSGAVEATPSISSSPSSMGDATSVGSSRINQGQLDSGAQSPSVLVSDELASLQAPLLGSSLRPDGHFSEATSISGADADTQHMRDRETEEIEMSLFGVSHPTNSFYDESHTCDSQGSYEMPPLVLCSSWDSDEMLSGMDIHMDAEEGDGDDDGSAASLSDLHVAGPEEESHEHRLGGGRHTSSSSSCTSILDRSSGVTDLGVTDNGQFLEPPNSFTASWSCDNVASTEAAVGSAEAGAAARVRREAWSDSLAKLAPQDSPPLIRSHVSTTPIRGREVTEWDIYGDSMGVSDVSDRKEGGVHPARSGAGPDLIECRGGGIGSGGVSPGSAQPPNDLLLEDIQETLDRRGEVLQTSEEGVRLAPASVPGPTPAPSILDRLRS